MYFSKLVFASIFFNFIVLASSSQNNPDFDTPGRPQIIVNSGQNIIILPNVTDGDTIDQELNFDIVSSDPDILKIDSTTHNPGDNLALIWVFEQGALDSATLSVTINDVDGIVTKDFTVDIVEYDHHGVKFEIHDAVFWQEIVPLDDTPIYGSIIQSTNMATAYSALNWNAIPLTVSAGCNNASLCDGHDFTTGFLEGFLAPKKTGNYNFYINGDSQYALFLSSDESFGNATVIAAESDNHGKIGALVDGRKSAAVALDSGSVYAFYAVQWNVHHENGGVKWELPGVIEPTYIDGQYLFPEYDTQRPDVIHSIKVNAKGDRFIDLSWDQTTDNQKIDGYNVYLNGVKMNDEKLDKTSYFIDNLTPNTNYSVVVTALDRVMNESFIDTVVNVKTLPPDNEPPLPPSTFTADIITGLAMKISWEGASDGQSFIYGYKVYLDGELYNTDSLVSNNSIILQVLEPETEYTVEVESVDAGMNVSEKSSPFSVSTVKFDPLTDNLGLNTGKLTFSTEAMSFNEGLGVNPNYKGGDVFNAAHTTLFEDLKPGAIRWGALTANPLSFDDYTGAGKSVTIGKFMARCNEFNAYTAFCCGVENSTDWRQDPETFVRFIEYINGPDDSPGGQLRVAEGFTEPLLKNSPGLIFEFGNEVWGKTTHNAQIGADYVVYAEWCREMALKMKASPYYDSTKIFLAYSSRYPARESSYGLNEKIIDGTDGEVEWTAPSGYLGGNLNYDPAFPPADSELEYYQNVRNRADIFLDGMFSSHKYEVVETGRLLEQYMYESNTTTPTYNGRLGQALLSTDYYLSAMELGSAIPTIFHLTGGQWRITEPENNYRRLPLFLTARYINNYCKGDVLYNTYESNQMGATEQGALFSERPVGIHTYRNNNGYSIVFISRDYVEDHYVQLDLPDDMNFNPNGQIITLSGANFSTKNTSIDTTEITVNDSMVVKVPRHAMILLHFTAEDITMENLPLAYYPYPRMEEIALSEESYTFTEASETKRIDAQILPSNSWDKVVEWELLYNSGNYGILKYDMHCLVYASNDLSNESDSMILRASNREGDVISEVVLYPTNPVVKVEDEAMNGIDVYPNPARGKLYVESVENHKARIVNVNGTVVIETNLNKGRNEIDISGMIPGVYALHAGKKVTRVIISE